MTEPRRERNVNAALAIVRNQPVYAMISHPFIFMFSGFFQRAGSAGFRTQGNNPSNGYRRTVSSPVPIVFCALLSIAASGPFSVFGATSKIDFNREIRPMLSESCYTCHGPDEKTRKAKLRLDIKEGIFATRDGESILTPGDSEHSEIIRRLTTTDEDDRMPPKDSGKVLTQVQIDRIRQWIDEGAQWEQHWAFVKAQAPDVPENEDSTWPKNEIDQFILSRLKTEGLQPSPQASKETLVRRASFDLRGLPPTLEEVEAFLNDDSPDSYEALIDRLLTTPQYGEKMAIHWLDLARYADTHGYHLDSGRDMSRWRDWVIEAFNSNMPFDQFTLEQTAGDLLPNASVSQKLATGFNRNNMINFEGGAIPEEYLTYYIRDRVATTSTVFLGLTMACAQCHDHKFDPISQKEFYQFYAYFNAVPEKGLDGGKGNAAPLLELPSQGQKKHLEELTDAIDRAKQEFQNALPKIDRSQADWETQIASRDHVHWNLLKPVEMRSAGGADLKILDDGSVLATGANPQNETYELSAKVEGETITGIRLEAFNDRSLPGRGPGRADNSNFVLTEVELDVVSTGNSDASRKVDFKAAIADYSQTDYGVANAVDGNPKTGWAVDGSVRHRDAVAWFLPSKPIETDSESELRFRLRFEGPFPKHSIGRFRISWTTSAAVSHPGPIAPETIEKILATPSIDRPDKERAVVQKYYRENISGEYLQLEKSVTELENERSTLMKEIPTSMVMAQMETPRDTFVLIRGQYNEHGETVKPGIPASLSPLPSDAPANRLGLAQWLIDPENPLVARVTVNRFWALLMGTGIVKTANDFGTKGELPTHPELLDWIATDFVRNRWDVKRLIKMIVTSAAYRQSAVATAEMIEKDPYNRIYARGPRFRLSAEEIHDTALAVSGILDNSIGGSAVFPYQPPGLWEELSSRKDSKNWSAQFYTQSHGKDLYRRGIYTFWKRTSPPPSLQAFDAPDRETCIVQRDRTSTPLQALILMNDPTYVEAARKLANRMMTDGGSSPEDRIRFAFRLATSRFPSQLEIDLLKNLYQQQFKRFQEHPEAAEQYLSVGESSRNPSLDPASHAAWTSVASMILNLDETITKG
ncbi:MAG: PSD1 and planctomycete cytochrome C domain-containing protein [Verrucomicrobia bacterium]|nr:PSD1 and planctomycete cytochrome C domain-containing protein [Verrucomicrobiota bacterium]